MEEEEAETRVKLKAMREHHKKWEGTRDKRINSWRDFASNKKAKKAKPLGGIKPPKLKVATPSVAVCACLSVLQGCCHAGARLACKVCCLPWYLYITMAPRRPLWYCRWRTRIAPTFSGRQWSSSRRPASLRRQSAFWPCCLCAGRR